MLVSNLNQGIDTVDLMEVFKTAGDIKKIVMPQKTLATVIYKTRSAAQKAVAEFNNRELDGRPMVVVIKQERPPKVVDASGASTERSRQPKRKAPSSEDKPAKSGNNKQANAAALVAGELKTKRQKKSKE